MRIAELARRADVKVSTVRFYERSGVLAPPSRSPGGYRDYDDDAVQQVRYLRRGQELGFRLAELSAFSSMSTLFRAGQLSGGQVADAAAQKLREIDARIDDLTRTRAAIEGLLVQQCADPAEPCPIVAALAGEPTAR